MGARDHSPIDTPRSPFPYKGNLPEQETIAEFVVLGQPAQMRRDDVRNIDQIMVGGDPFVLISR
jgi:hypothetical protein